MAMTIPDKYWTGQPLFAAGLPWLTPGAIKVLENIVSPSFHVLEFGGGGSTRFFVSRCARVITWETDERWRACLRKLIHSSRWTLLDDLETVWALPDLFDLVMVDSDGKRTNRQYISEQSLRFVRPGGWFILDNYSRYKLGFLRDWNCFYYDDSHWSGSGTLLAKYH